MRKVRDYCGVFGATLGLIAAPSWAETVANPNDAVIALESIPTVEKLQAHPTTVKEWRSQVESPTQITSIQLSPNNAGLDIVLNTPDGKSLQIDATKFRADGNSLIADIANAKLANPDFSAANPTTDISLVQVNQLNSSTVRVIVFGNNALPKQEVAIKTGGVAYSLNANAADPEEEVVITGDRPSPFLAPNSSTATRTDTPLRDIPQAIQVVPRQFIEERQATKVEDALKNVSSVTFLGNSEGRDSVFAIRGFSSSSSSVLRDGFRSFSTLGSPEVANLERIEVLKGPASVLYGQGDPGGVINLVSKQPLALPYANLQLQTGNRGYINPSVDLSGPLSEDGQVRYRLNALYRRENSFRNYDNSFNRFFIAPTLAFAIGKQTDLTLNFEYGKDSNPADFGTLAFGKGIANIPPERVTNNPSDIIENQQLNVGYNLEHRFDDNWKLRNQFRYSFDEYDYGILALPVVFNETTGILTRAFADQSNRTSAYNLYTNIQGKFNTGDIKHNLLFGIDLSRSISELETRFSFNFLSSIDIFNPDYSQPKPASTIPIAFGNKSTSDRLGIYLQDQIDLTDNLILLAGLRYDTVNQNTTQAVGGAQSSQYNDALTTRIGLVYKPIPNLSLYTSYAQSFEPSFNRDAQGLPLKPETGRGFELGLKADIIENQLTANLAYFNITKQNVATADPNSLFDFIATGEQQSQGIDFDLVGQILPGWNVVASYAYIDARITRDNNIPVGNRRFGVPEHSASLYSTYEIQSGDLRGLGFSLGGEFVGVRFGNNINNFQVDSYFLTNAAVFYKRDNWVFRLNIDNLFDVDYIRSVNNDRVRNISPGLPFTLRASLGVTF